MKERVPLFRGELTKSEMSRSRPREAHRGTGKPANRYGTFFNVFIEVLDLVRRFSDVFPRSVFTQERESRHRDRNRKKL